MTITSSPHLAPDDVARHTFASVRRGFDPGRGPGLPRVDRHRPAGHWPSASRSCSPRWPTPRTRAANPVIDDAMLTAAVGKETARVLQSAHDAAAEMVANAEAEAARMLAEATEVSDRLVTEATEVSEQAQARADALLAERLAEAEAASTALQERTEQQVAAALDKVRADAEELTERARCRGSGHGGGGPGAAGPGAGRPVPPAQGAPRPDRPAPGRAASAWPRRSTTSSARSRPSPRTLFNAEDEARLAAEVAGREAAARPDEGTPEELAALLLAEEAGGRAGRRRPEAVPAVPRSRRRRPVDGSADVADGRDEEPRPMPPGPRRRRPDRRRRHAARRAGRRPLRQAAGRPGRRGRRAAGPPAGRPPPGSDGSGRRRRGPAAEAGATGPTGRPRPRNPLAVRRDELLAPHRHRRWPGGSSGRSRTTRTTCSTGCGPRAPPGRPTCCPTRPSSSTRSPPPPCPCSRRPPTPVPAFVGAEGAATRRPTP